MNYGIQRYNQRTAATMSPREVEAMAFAQLVTLLKNAKDQKSRLHALSMHQKLWSAILRETGVENNGMPEVFRKDLLRLSLWATKYSIRAILHNISLKPLIDINQDMLDGLRTPAQGNVPTPPTPDMAKAEFRLVQA